MSEFLPFLNNREKAIIVWIVIALAYFLNKASTRKPILSLFRTVLKTFTSRYVAPLFVLFAAYIVLLIGLGYKTRLWNFELLKDTIIWFIGTSLILFMNSSDATKKEHFFRNEIAKNLRFALIVIFLINLYVFNFYVELLFMPFVTFVIMMSVLSESKPEFKPVKKLTQIILVLLGFLIVTHAFTSLIKGFHNFDTLQTLRDFLLAPVLTIMVLPVVYLLAVYSTYEMLFVQLRHRNKGYKPVVRYAMWEVMKVCRLRLKKVAQFSKDHYAAVTYLDDRADVDELVKKNKVNHR